METKILSVNCQGLGSLEKRRDVFNFIKTKHCSIYCLQDIHSTPKTEKLIRTQWGCEAIFSSGTSNSRGVAILLEKGLDFKINNFKSDSDGNYIIADLTVNSNRFTLANIYGPNNDSPTFYENIMNQIDTYTDESVILCGDFNLVQDPKLDYYNYKNINNLKAQKKILEIKEIHNLFDPYREKYPDLKRYTWRKKNPLKQARLDFFLVTDNLRSSIHKCNIENSYRSDHSIIILNIAFNTFQKGRPLWKHNNSLLKEIEYLEVINKKIKEIKVQYAIPVYNIENIENIPNDKIQFVINDQLFLETLLMEIRGKSISYSTYKKKCTDILEVETVNEIRDIENNLTPDQ